MEDWTLESFKPKIKKGTISPVGRNFVYTSDQTASVELPVAVADVILLCDGVNTIHQILSRIHERQGVVQFQKVVQTLVSLIDSDLFEQDPDLEKFKGKMREVQNGVKLQKETFLGRTRKILPFFNSKELFARTLIQERIESNSFFSEFSEEGFEKLLDSCEVVVYSKGQFVIEANEQPSDIYLLLDGECEAVGNGFKGVIHKGSFFGEGALMALPIRAATVRALETSKVLRLPVSVIRENIENEKHLEVLRRQIIVSQYFGSSNHFAGVRPSTIETIQRLGQLEIVGSDQVIFEDGDRTNGLYFLVRGSVRVEVSLEKQIDLHQGDLFGEISVLAKLPRTARVVSREPSFLFKVSLEAFWEVLLSDLNFAYKIEQLCEERLADDFEILQKKNSKPA